MGLPGPKTDSSNAWMNSRVNFSHLCLVPMPVNEARDLPVLRHVWLLLPRCWSICRWHGFRGACCQAPCSRQMRVQGVPAVRLRPQLCSRGSRVPAIRPRPQVSKTLECQISGRGGESKFWGQGRQGGAAGRGLLA